MKKQEILNIIKNKLSHNSSLASLAEIGLDTYIELQKDARLNVSFAVRTDRLRANLRNELSDLLNIDVQTFQESVEEIAMSS